jgi:hypothetical protein
MTLLIQVENSLHEVLDDFSDEDGTFIRLCGRVRRDSAADWRVLNIVDPYSDTMLNRIQQLLLRTELEQVRQRPDLLEDAGPMVERVGAALDRVLDGDAAYLTFIGE